MLQLFISCSFLFSYYSYHVVLNKGYQNLKLKRSLKRLFRTALKLKTDETMRRERRKIARRCLFKCPSAALVAINFSLPLLLFRLLCHRRRCLQLSVSGVSAADRNPLGSGGNLSVRLIIVVDRSRDRWPARQTHNAKKTPAARPTPLITTAPARMRRRKSFVHFSLYILSPRLGDVMVRKAEHAV